MFILRYIKRLGSKIYRTVYLAESYRVGKKTKHIHLANLSKMPDNLIDALERELKGEPSKTTGVLEFTQGKSCGGLIAVKEVCKRLGIIDALGKDEQAPIALLQIIGRVLCQGSRLYIASQWSGHQALNEVLHIDTFNEDTLYANLDWLSENQEKIEKKIFKFRYPDKKLKTVYLYDVTSSYLEGTHNELAAFGYNRDKKQGKMQIVIGLLCDDDGYPVSVQVFEGNTQDVTTVTDQLQKLKTKFGVEQVVFVGDRGMIKSASISEITEMSWYYITAITKPQIETLLKKELFQLELFTHKLMEVKEDEIRYVLHRNAMRAEEIAGSRQRKIEVVQKLAELKNKYFSEHPGAKEQVALQAVENKASQLKIDQCLEIQCKEREITVKILEDKIKEIAQLDGCYVIKSNLPESLASTDTLHDRYKDLAMVEQAFRTMKQAFEEIRPIYVRKKKRTRGHVFVCMLAYMVIKYVWNECKDLNINQTNLFDSLDRIQYVQYDINGVPVKAIPKNLSENQTNIIGKLKIKMPSYV